MSQLSSGTEPKGKLIRNCTDADFQKLKGAARAHAHRMRREHLAEEFASFSLEAMVKQGYLRYHLPWLWSTFMRDVFGNRTNKKGRAKADANSKMGSIEDLSSKDRKLINTLQSQDPSPDERLEWNEFLSKLDLRTRIILVLRFEFDFDSPDIGRVIGTSHQRVHQITTDLFQRYRDKKVLVPPGRGRRK